MFAYRAGRRRELPGPPARIPSKFKVKGFQKRFIEVQLAKKYLPTPSTEEAWKEIAEEFENEWNLPHVIGALDGKHIAIKLMLQNPL